MHTQSFSSSFFNRINLSDVTISLRPRAAVFLIFLLHIKLLCFLFVCCRPERESRKAGLGIFGLWQLSPTPGIANGKLSQNPPPIFPGSAQCRVCTRGKPSSVWSLQGLHRLSVVHSWPFEMNGVSSWILPAAVLSSGTSLSDHQTLWLCLFLQRYVFPQIWGYLIAPRFQFFYGLKESCQLTVWPPSSQL